MLEFRSHGGRARVSHQSFPPDKIDLIILNEEIKFYSNDFKKS